MQGPRLVIDTQAPQDGEKWNKSSTERWSAMKLGEGNKTNDNVLESNGQREQHEDEKGKGRT